MKSIPMFDHLVKFRSVSYVMYMNIPETRATHIYTGGIINDPAQIYLTKKEFHGMIT